MNRKLNSSLKISPYTIQNPIDLSSYSGCRKSIVDLKQFK